LQPASACLPCRARHRQVMPVQQRRGIQCRGYKHVALSSCLCVLVAMIADAARRAGPARPTSANCAFSELLRVPPSARIHRSALMVWPRRSPWMLPEWERPPRRDVCGHGARRGCCQSGSGLRAAMFVATALAVDAARVGAASAPRCLWPRRSPWMLPMRFLTTDCTDCSHTPLVRLQRGPRLRCASSRRHLGVRSRHAAICACAWRGAERGGPPRLPWKTQGGTEGECLRLLGDLRAFVCYNCCNHAAHTKSQSHQDSTVPSAGSVVCDHWSGLSAFICVHPSSNI
jgi:hypothetical protein